MGAKNKRKKEPKVLDAEITADGCLVVELNVALPMGNSKKLLIPPETLLALGEEYASMPPAADNEYPGVPVLELDDVFQDVQDGEEEDDDEAAEEEG